MSSYAHLIWAGVALLALLGGVAYERHAGAQSCVLAQTKLALKQEAQNTADASAAAVQVQREVTDHAQAVAAPVRAPVVRVCPAAQPPHPGGVLQTPAAAPGADAPAPVSDPAQSDPRGRDIGTPIEKVGQAADAQIAGLEDYITNVCLRR
jgi:hypothetical protein